MDEPSPYASRTGTSFAFVENVPVARLLALLAGASALVLGVIMFFMQMASGPLEGPLGFFGRSAVIMMLIINAVFGAFLLAAYAGWRGKEKEWSVLVLAFSLVLLVLGGIGGAVAGILGLVAAVYAFVHKPAEAPALPPASTEPVITQERVL